jgi:hypothetical protein
MFDITTNPQQITNKPQYEQEGTGIGKKYIILILEVNEAGNCVSGTGYYICIKSIYIKQYHMIVSPKKTHIGSIS